MANYHGPVCRFCRREGVKLMLKGNKCVSKCTMDKRKSAPGQAKKKMRSKPSEYHKRLREKQRAKIYTGIMEKQFRRYYTNASKMKGSTGENLLMLLETRLDSILRLCGFCTSIKTSRQMIRHGFVAVNGRNVDIPSYQTQKGDVVALHASLKENPVIKKSMEDSTSKVIPVWMERNAENLSVKIAKLPVRAEMTIPVSEQLIVELYSK